jgi:hypothetical protein
MSDYQKIRSTRFDWHRKQTVALGFVYYEQVKTPNDWLGFSVLVVFKHMTLFLVIFNDASRHCTYTSNRYRAYWYRYRYRLSVGPVE